MLVRSSDIESVKAAIERSQFVAVDTETYGLRQFHGDKPFSVIVVVETDAFYIPVQVSAGVTKRDLIDISGWSDLFRGKTVFLHNAKFDMHHLATIGFRFPPECKIHDTMVASRLCDSNLISYSLDYCASHFLGAKKDDKVKQWIMDNDAFTAFRKLGTETRGTKLHFDRVPLDLIVPYGLQDGRITYDLGMEQLRLIDELDKTTFALNEKAPRLRDLLELEYRVTVALYEMEQQGVLLDEDVARESIAHCEEIAKKEREAYAGLTGKSFKSSSKAIVKDLDESGYDISQLSLTDKGNICVDRDALEKIDNPIAEHVLKFKDAKSRVNIFNGFIYEADAKCKIHTSFKQSGARTGRLSSAAPNLQNLTRTSESTPHVNPRSCITPDPGDCMVMIDYDQMEYRIMLDYAGQMDVIEMVKGGLDVHAATAGLVNIERDRAKTLNFAIIYGSGPGLIGESLGISTYDARELIDEYFHKLPDVSRFIELVKQVAKIRKFTYNWMGRQNHYYGHGAKAYAAVNHLIQGSAADVMRVGLVECRDILKCMKSSIRLTVHDELIFNVKPDELYVIPALKAAMEKAYRHRYLPLTASVSHSWQSWGHKVKGLPCSESPSS